MNPRFACRIAGLTAIFLSGIADSAFGQVSSSLSDGVQAAGSAVPGFYYVPPLPAVLFLNEYVDGYELALLQQTGTLGFQVNSPVQGTDPTWRVVALSSPTVMVSGSADGASSIPLLASGFAQVTSPTSPYFTVSGEFTLSNGTGFTVTTVVSAPVQLAPLRPVVVPYDASAGGSSYVLALLARTSNPGAQSGAASAASIQGIVGVDPAFLSGHPSLTVVSGGLTPIPEPRATALSLGLAALSVLTLRTFSLRVARRF